jgi:type 1 fimbria pilin
MLNIQTHLWAGPGPKILRWLLWVVLFAAFLTMNESHAQKCTSSTVLVNQTLPTTMPFSFSSGTKVLGSYEATATLSGCSGFTTTTPLILTQAVTEAIIPTVTLPTVSGRQFLVSGDRVACFRINMCFNSSNTSFFDTATPVAGSGISHEYTAQINGLDNLLQECVASLTNPDQGSGGIQNILGNWIFRKVRINFSNNACSTITIKVTGRITQTAAFYKSNAQTIRLDTANDGSTNFRFVLVSDTSNPVFTAIDLFSSPATLTSQPGTCALSLSPTALNMGNFTPAQVTAIAQGNAVSTKPLAITIGNCTGFPAGKNKVLQWTFAKPSADLTQMTNAAVLSPSQGLSAEILADQKFTLDAIPVAMGSNKVKSGENYITSGKTSDNQTLNYTVRLVRNSQTVTNGGFTSTATVTMSYQ